MLIGKFHPGIKDLHVFVSFFHPGVKLYPCLFERMPTREISSWDELIPVKKTEMKFHPGMKKRKKDL